MPNWTCCNPTRPWSPCAAHVWSVNARDSTNVWRYKIVAKDRLTIALRAGNRVVNVRLCYVWILVVRGAATVETAEMAGDRQVGNWHVSCQRSSFAWFIVMADAIDASCMCTTAFRSICCFVDWLLFRTARTVPGRYRGDDDFDRNHDAACEPPLISTDHAAFTLSARVRISDGIRRSRTVLYLELISGILAALPPITDELICISAM